MSIARLLEACRFYDHPFATWIAEAEKETDLAEWFVDPIKVKGDGSISRGIVYSG